MKPLKHNLFRQLISIGIIMFGIIFISLGLLLPRVLIPVYEKTIYNYLKQPLDIIHNKIEYEIVSDIAYLFVYNDNNIYISDNLEAIIPVSPIQILEKIDRDFGKFKYLGKTYYYYTSDSDNDKKIALTDSTYINLLKKEVMYTIFPIIVITFLIIITLVIYWARTLVIKIQLLKDKIEKLDDDNYTNTYKFKADDELNLLSNAIDNMHKTIKKQEEYKNQMYQNISHDFKTPLTVMKSYIEALDDGVLDKTKGYTVIKQQLNKLENKVHSLLYLNKLNYISDYKGYKNEKIDITPILNESIEKFKYKRPDVNWELRINDNDNVFTGTVEMWETIIDNMLNNFIRFAEKKIKISIKNKKIHFFNDGPNIDERILYDLFTPYKKGVQGQFGFGLSIIKKSLYLMGYEINVYNTKKGVQFIID